MQTSKLYNFIYMTTNTINGKRYIGVHRTANIDDGYLGSGKLIKLAIKKHGAKVFTRTILEFFDTYEEALARERELVNSDFCDLADVYNLAIGGNGGCTGHALSEEHKKILSACRRRDWKDPQYIQKMLAIFNSSERRDAISAGVRRWIANNPQAHIDKMQKINTNPDKIAKTAEKHRGSIRSKQSRITMSKSAKAAFLKNPELYHTRAGKGSMYIHNPVTGSRLRISAAAEIPEGYVRGLGIQTKLKLPRGSTVYIVNKSNTECVRHLKVSPIPDGWKLGRLNRSKHV